jgi:hypothetical protein
MFNSNVALTKPICLDDWELRPGDRIPAKSAGHNRGKPQTLCGTSSGPRVRRGGRTETWLRV